jgi:hypothetical protein
VDVPTLLFEQRQGPSGDKLDVIGMCKERKDAWHDVFD